MAPALPDVELNPGNFHEENFIAGKLGEGSYGCVYAVSKSEDEEARYAAKVVEMRTRKGGDFSADMAVRELQTLRKVTETGSAHVVHLKDSFSDGRFLYMVTERCDSTLLGALRASETITEATYRPIFRQMLWGLAAIHSVGVVHRDVKPDNFMCSGSGAGLVVKLCDFGLAKAVARPGRCDLSGVNGTAPFLAPEMVKGERYGEKVDAWSVGAIAYLLLYGHFPYMPLVWSAAEMQRAIREGAPAPRFAPRLRGRAAPELAEAISVEAEGLVALLLSRAPRGRPTATEASQHDFFQRAEAEGALPSLRPMLLSAEHCGGFDERGANKEAPPSEVDVVMAFGQLRHGRASDWSRQTTAATNTFSLTPSTASPASSPKMWPAPTPTSTPATSASSGRLPPSMAPLDLE